MNAIPLIRTRYLQAFAEVVNEMGVRPAILAEDLKIPEKVFEDPDTLHPAHQFFAFAGHASRVTGRADLGLAAGLTKIEDHGDFGLQVTRSLTLHQAMGRFCAEALKEYSRAFFWIERRGETTWFCREKIDGEPNQRRQTELYLVELMLQTIRMVAGPRWQPQELWLQTDEHKEFRDTETLSQINVRFGYPILAIPVPRRLMSRTVPRHRRNRLQADGCGCPTKPPNLPATDFVGSLKQVLQVHLSSGCPGVDALAEVAGTSVRTLQRRLRSEGTSYTQIVDEVRLQTALPMLEDPGVMLTAIAFDLGYSDPAHFTRAFRRWAGVAPSEFRAHHLMS